MTERQQPGKKQPNADPLLQYLGHAAFHLTTPGRVRLVIDPFQNPRGRRNWFRKKFPALKLHIIAVTHDHFDHNAAHALGGISTVLKTRARVKVKDLEVKLVPERHSRALHRHPDGDGTDMLNHLVVVESHGVRLCHVGDNRHDIAPEAIEAVGRVDVLTVPVDDSQHLLTYEEVDRMIEALNPRVVVPMHYFQEGLTTEASTLEGIDGWLASLGPDVHVRHIGSPEITLASDTLPEPGGCPGRHEVWVMQAALAGARQTI